MKYTKTLSIYLVVLLLQACSGQRSSTNGWAYDGAEQGGFDKYTEQETLTESLFKTKDQTLTEENIQRLLNGKIRIPDTVRIAVFKYNTSSVNRYYRHYWYDEEYLKFQQSYVDELVAQVKTANRVKKVILMPSLMIPQKPNITELRESAVRLQADMLLVFSVTSNIYYKSKTFSKDEAKAFATTETILMDIRTGVIPHSSVVTKENFVKKEETDITIEETRKRAETGAVLLSLSESGKNVAGFLNER